MDSEISERPSTMTGIEQNQLYVTNDKTSSEQLQDKAEVFIDIVLAENPTQESDVDETSSLMFLQKIQDLWVLFYAENRKKVLNTAVVLFFTVYAIFFSFALVYSIENATALIVLTCIVLFLMAYTKIKNLYGSRIYKSTLRPAVDFVNRHRTIITWSLYPLAAILIILYLVLEVYESSKQLVPFVGMLVLLSIAFLTSKHITRIQLRPVIWSLGFQFLIGVTVLRWKPGYNALQFLTDQIISFLTYSLAGAALAFGDPWFFLHPFVFLVSSMVIFVGGMTGLLFHIGAIQIVIVKIAWLMRHTLGTTGIESVSLIANTMFTTLDIMQMFRSYTPKLTQSEFHTFTVGSHCSIAGFAYGLFVIFGASPQHLLTASVMSAPAAVAISKLNYPETRESYFKDEQACKIETRRETSVFEAITNGALESAKMILMLLLQVIIFMSVFEWADVTVAWFGSQVGLDISLRIIFSYIFEPFAYLIGVDPKDVRKVSSVVGLKLFTSEMLAFIELGQLRMSGAISERSAAITTYAISGFSSIGTLFMTANVYAVISKQTARKAISQLPRIYINCNIACFLTACIAGILYSEDVLENDGRVSGGSFLPTLFSVLPSYKDILGYL